MNPKKDELVGYSTLLPDAKCSFCGGTKELNQYEVDDIIKELPVTKMYYVCKECAKEKGLTHYPSINI